MPNARWKTAAYATGLFLIGAWVCGDLFFIEYTNKLGSIEAAYISISRYLLAHPTELMWFPLWYNGVPYQNTYPPVLHIMVALFAALARTSPALAHHCVTALLYALGPVTVFWLAHRLTQQRWASALAAGVYALFSPSAFLVATVRHDIGGLFRARRLHCLIEYGEGPHIASMTLLPLAILLLDRALERRRALDYLLAAASLAAVVLTNWLGGFALAAAVVALLMARARDWRDWGRAALIGVYAYLLAACWIPPTTLLAVRMNAQRVGGAFGMGPRHLLYFAILAAATLAIHYAVRRMRGSAALEFGAVYSLLMTAITLAAEWGVYIVPQPQRYHLEMEMALCLLIAPVFLVFPHGRMRHGLAALVLVFLAVQVVQYTRYSRRLIEPADMSGSIEYKMARWFDANMQGRRIFAPGTISFWMNTFTDTPQFGGGFEQGIVNPLQPVASYQIYSSENAAPNPTESAVAWLKAYGVHAVAIGGAASREYYKPFRHTDKFNSLAELWRDGDDRIYRIAQRSDSLARVIRAEHLLKAPPPYGNDAADLMPYVRGLDDPSLPLADFRWVDMSNAHISATLSPEHLVSVQISWHPGWSARVNGRDLEVRKDALHQVLLEPRCSGECEIDLRFTGGTEMVLARLASWGGALLGLGAIALSAARRRR